MDALLVGFIVFDIFILFLIFRFMTKKLERKIDLVEKMQRTKWKKDEAKFRDAFASEEE
ncbi:MAG: hypothetical protein QF807_02985 [Candidatus Thalassarchaeaceae archaeon]|jgi:uncharacterized membrane-anchored protein YhcB (DUF1043 family)|nr:hypothetical protein [Candidatus Thalassarchaeaceae archaeon]|tara:strand:- start:872 stop:1048 length:177 start_codon:yes stop_codon:yes gene_type:complete